ncbi:MAG: glutamate--tRNA ligase [bacterium]
MKNTELAKLLFPNITKSKSELLASLPKRSTNTTVTRFAPSPTGFLHIGGVYTALIDYFIAKQSEDGVFILRIEDTDKKREVANSKQIICDCFKEFGINIDEGVVSEDKQLGEYGSYIQSERIDLYHTLAYDLVERGLAYPCFATEEELQSLRDKQTSENKTPGYYKEYALYRDANLDVIKNKLKENNNSFVLRFRVADDAQERISFVDKIKGDIEMENNINDFVLLKENGIPTYHFAHACDDHTMGTTIVIRGDEWLSSVPVHLQLFNALEFELPTFAHVAPIMKLDGESRRKLSKRKDPESSAEFYLEKGYPIRSVYAYILTLINSNFEEWYANNQDADLFDFKVTFENMSRSGSLYDIVKLNSISSEIIYNTSLEDNFNNLVKWATKYDKEVLNRINVDVDFVKRLLSTQGPLSNEKRKDMVCYSDFMHMFGPIYNDVFDSGNNKELLAENIKPEYQEEVINELVSYFSNDNNEETLKDIAKRLGYVDKKKFAKDPEAYKGVVFNFYKGLRLLLTNQEHGISLDDIILVLSKEEKLRRLKK